MVKINDRTRYAYNFYVSRGYSPAAAAGIVGNLNIESGGFSPAVISGQRRGDNGTAFGAAQHRHERLANMERYARQQNKGMGDLDMQLGFIDHEMRNGLDAGAGRAYRALQNPNITPDQAAASFMNHFERPAANPNINHIALRQEVARGLMGGGASTFQPTPVPAGQAPAVPQAQPQAQGAPQVDTGALPVQAAAYAPPSPAAGASNALSAISNILLSAGQGSAPPPAPALNAVAQRASQGPQVNSQDPLGLEGGTEGAPAPTGLLDMPAPASTPTPASGGGADPIASMLSGMDALKTDPYAAQRAGYAADSARYRAQDTDYKMDAARRVGEAAAAPYTLQDIMGTPSAATVQSGIDKIVGPGMANNPLMTGDMQPQVSGAPSTSPKGSEMLRSGFEWLTGGSSAPAATPGQPADNSPGGVISPEYTRPTSPAAAPRPMQGPPMAQPMQGPPMANPNVATGPWGADSNLRAPGTATGPWGADSNLKQGAPPKKPFDTLGFLQALGGITAALGGGNGPELNPPSLSGVLHKPSGFNGLPMPRGLL